MEIKVPAVGTLTKQKCRCNTQTSKATATPTLTRQLSSKDGGAKVSLVLQREEKDTRGPTSECPVSLSPWPCHL